MQYRKDRYGEQISLLGYGCMRFTKNGNSIDLDKAERELMLAIKSGVNYLDTAYIYPGSEVAVGEILHRNHCREEIRLATKLPQYYIKSGAAIEKYFNEQLTRLQTDYIDYYLMHMLTDVAAWEKLKKLGIEATAKNINDLKLQKANEEKVAKEILEAAKAFAEDIKEKSVTVTIKTGEGGKTFGSVSSKEIAAAYKSQLNVEIDKKKLQLAEPVRSLGVYKVPYKVHPKVTAELTVKVAEA